MRQLYPALRPCRISDVYAEPPPDGADRTVALNVVTTVDGRAAIGGTSSGIGGATDKLLMRRIRSRFDAVLTGAGTLRREGIGPGVPPELGAEREARGMPPQPLTVLLGGQAGVTLPGRLRTLDPGLLVVFLPEAAPAGEIPTGTAVHRTPGERPAPEEVVRALEERHGVRRLLVEGGPRVYGAFLRAGLIDELYWTLAPKLSGGDNAPGMFEGPPLPAGARGLRLLSLYEHHGELYLRYALGEETKVRYRP